MLMILVCALVACVAKVHIISQKFNGFRLTLLGSQSAALSLDIVHNFVYFRPVALLSWPCDSVPSTLDITMKFGNRNATFPFNEDPSP